MSRFNRIASALFSPLLDLFLPDLCLACKEQLEGRGNYLCSSCWQKLPLYPDKSGDPSRRLRGVLDRLWIAWNYREQMRQIIHLFKYHYRPELADRLVSEWLKVVHPGRIIREDTLIVPVPIHTARLRSRGFNQSELLVEQLSAKLQVEASMSNAIRIINTPSQTRLGISQRWRSVESAFKIQDPAQFRDRSVLIIDDLVTSGATLHALASQLWPCGPRSVSAAVLASPTDEGQAI